MSWTDEEIDNLFQESATAQSFEYNDAYFSEVEALLPVNKKGKDFLWMGTALLFIIALTAGYVVTNSNGNSLNSYSNQLANAQLNGNKSNEIKNKTSENSTNSNVNSTQNMSEAALTNEATLINKTTLQNTQTAAANSKVNVKSDTEKASDLVRKSLAGMYPQSQNDQNIQQTLAESMNVRNPNAVSTLGLKAGLSTLELESLNSQVDASGRNQQTIFEEQNSYLSELPTNSANEIDQNLDRSLIPNALTLPPLSQLRPKAALYFELNGGVSQSLIASSNASNTAVGAGLGVETYLGNFNLTTGLNFKLSNFNDLSYSGSGLNYGYGSVHRAGSVNYEKLYTIEMPIALGYNFGKHNLNIGVRPSFVIGSKYQETSFKNGELSRSSETYGFTDDLKRFNVKSTIGYAYHLNQWTIGGNVGVQLMQSVYGEEMNVTNRRLPIDGQVYLRRTIRLR